MVMGEPKPEISVVVENYLQAIYKLKEKDELVVPARGRALEVFLIHPSGNPMMEQFQPTISGIRR